MEATNINQAIRLARERVIELPSNGTGRSSALDEIARGLALGYSDSGVIEELDEAIKLFREAVDGASPDEPDRATSMSNLGNALGFKYDTTHSLQDLDATLQVLKEALDVTPQQASTWLVCLGNMGMRLGQRYEHTKAPGDLHEGIKYSQAAVMFTSKDDPSRVSRLHALGKLLFERYLVSKDDLHDSIRYWNEANMLRAPGDPDRAQTFTALGNAMTEMYTWTSQDAHLDDAIRMLQQGLQSSPRDQPYMAVWYNNLGHRLAQRFARAGSRADFEESIHMAYLSLEATPRDDPQWYDRKTTLANRLCTKFHITGAMEYLDEAIAISEDVVSNVPEDASERPWHLNSLGGSYATKFLRTADEADIKNAINNFRKALGLPLRTGSIDRNSPRVRGNVTTGRGCYPPGHPDMAQRLANASRRLVDQFTITGDTAHLDEAVSLGRKSVTVAPPESPILAECLECAGRNYLLRHSKSGNREDRVEARDCFEKALSMPNAPITARVRAGRVFLSLPGISEDQNAFNVARSAIDLIPLLTTRSLQNSDKRHALSAAVGMASDAAAIALETGESAESAIECLETGRGVIAGASFEQRDVSKLLRDHPNLGESFVVLRDQLDRPTTQDPGSSIEPEYEGIESGVLADTANNRRRGAHEQLMSLLHRIRSLDGFERFLLPASKVEMLNAATDGPIVILNISCHRCDALLIQQSQIRSIKLSSVSQDIVAHYAEQIESVGTLEWLWDMIVSPVLIALGFTTSGPEIASSAEWRRIWWIPTGRLTKFPLHAAGYHFGQHRETTLDRAVSSYAASVRAIIHGRRQPSNAPNPDAETQMDLVAVSMTETIGHDWLQHADREVEEVISVLDVKTLRAKRPKKYKIDVLAALENCKIFHFAGHGSTNIHDPLQSSLLLEDWQKDPLTVASLLQTDLGRKPPFLAYLSACGTGQIRNDISLDEGIHLANACQLAGIRHVIGTLWSVKDEHCVQMASNTYKFLRDNGITDVSVSRGLHYATRVLRDAWVEESLTHAIGKDTEQTSREMVFDGQPRQQSTPPAWVPYVHFGI